MAQLGTYSFTSRLLNYTEPYYIDGVAKTSFYSEVNTNISIDDKVFITNGYNDSESLFISRGKYVKNADGYSVLYTNNCQVVLDIPFSGISQSYASDDFDQYIKVYHITSQREFDYINKLYVDIYTTGRMSKFQIGYTNNIIFADSAYFGNSSTGVQNNSGLSSAGQFWGRNGLTWVNITNQFNNNTFTFSSDYMNAGMSNNGRLYIVGEDFKYSGLPFKQRNIYSFSGDLNSWAIDIKYKTSIISKLYFKDGIFKGTHNDGIFGSYVGNPQDWYGTQSTWNSGFFVNSNWNSGLMNSKSLTASPSYYASIENGVVTQTTDLSNNKGFGYNYILDSNVYGGLLMNGNFINCNIGPTSSGLTAIDGYFGTNNDFQLESMGGLFNYCDVSSTKITNSTTLDSIVKNSYLEDTNTLNSQISDSYSNGGQFNINNGIDVISADLVSYIPNSIGGTSATSSSIRGVLKLYISDDDYNRLDIFDNFYITQINKNYILSSLSTDQQILLPYETRYILDTFYGSNSDFQVKNINQECFASLKGKSDNSMKVEANYSDLTHKYTNNLFSSTNVYSSIDIDLGQYLAFYKNVSNNTYTYINNSIVLSRENVQNLFSNTSITNSDFKNGVLNNTTWTGGSNVNYPSNKIQVANGKLQISKPSATELSIYLNEVQATINDDTQFKIGSYIWLDSIFHYDSSITDISGAYQITNVVIDPYRVNPVILTISNTTIVGSISSGGYFSVPDSLPLYASVNKLLIDNSTINSGLFVRTLVRNSNFMNSGFNNLDTSISNSNTEILRMVNMIFESNNNTINSGVVHKSHVLDVNWISGIINNSIWNGPTFGGGVFNNGYWENGTFNSGYFQNSLGITPSTVDYSNELHYNSWLDGIFNNGYFNNSVWINGVFNNGKLYNSNWYTGTWNYGILGDKNIPTMNTTMGKFTSLIQGATQTIWLDGIVNNAQIGGDGIVEWYGGNFNNGIFTSNSSDPNVSESIWYNGIFNGGNFTNMARWKDGIFNKGKFASYYGWTVSSSTYSTDYSWENGTFAGGQFGLGTYGTNSTWYDGEFDGGVFQGRVWNNGVFQNGSFNGGTTYSSSDIDRFVSSYTQSYYGLWRNGWVVDVKHKAITNQLIPTNNTRSGQPITQNSAILENVLWLTGNFDHQSGTIENSIWLSGTFSNGDFTSGVFNPYVDRSTWTSYTSPTFDLTTNCVWLNGTFDGLFYISDWNDGVFVTGTMSGARWIDGVWEYGYAKNIYWENGTWQNGIWDGDPFDNKDLGPGNIMLTGSNNDIITRVSNLMRNGKVHILNAFSATSSNEFLLDPTITGFSGWTYSNTGLLPAWQPISGGGLNLPGLVISSPSMTVTLYNSSYNGYVSTNSYTISCGANITNGDAFTVNIGGSYVTYIAVQGDTPGSVSYALYNLILNGVTQNIVQYQSVNQYGNTVIKYGTWGSISNGNVSVTPDIASIYSNLIDLRVVANYATPVTVTTVPVTLSSYGKSEILYGLSNVIGLTDSTYLFTDETNYNITLTVSSINGRTDFFVYVGDVIHNESLTSGTNTYTYQYTPLSPQVAGHVPSPRFGIQRVMYSNPGNSTFNVLSASIIEVVPTYNNNYNNLLFTYNNNLAPYDYGVGNIIQLPPELTTTAISSTASSFHTSNLTDVSIRFGNGAFKSGIWLGGFWNTGWRSTWNDGETSVIIFNDVNGVIESSDNLWDITLDAAPFSDISSLSVGDSVAIGNLVYIDINEHRNLVRDYYRIVGKTDAVGNNPATITVEISSNLPIRRIVQDSPNHMIYVTKNIWVSGIFYNGYFEGVWNYGLFTGYPYITRMGSTIWIDGLFDGGRFGSSQSYYVESGVTYSYNTGLIQNFTFRDNNLSQKGGFLYDSWIDVNYMTQSMTNIFKNNLRYNSEYNVIQSDGNLKGYPTIDVLASDSIFKNSFDQNYQYYKLGYAYTNYIDYMGDGSYFNYPISTSGSTPGVGKFVSNGWTFSLNSSTFTSNIGNTVDGVSDIESLSISYIGADGDILDNSYTSHIEKYRYSTVEFQLNSFSGSTHQRVSGDGHSLPSIFLLNDFKDVAIPGTVSVVINHAETPDIIKREYFYNRSSLEMFFISDSPFSANFSYIKFYETDMIPFFQYTTENNIDQSVKSPIYGTSSYGITFNNLVSAFNNSYPGAISNPQHIIPTTTTTTTTTTTSTTTTTTTLYGGNFILSPSYQLQITNISGSGLPSFALPAHSFTTTSSRFNSTLPIQSISVTLAADGGSGPTYRNLDLFVDSTPIDSVAVSGPGTYNLYLNRSVTTSSNVYVYIDLGNGPSGGGGGGCFIYETPITLLGGTYKSIGQISIGDSVLGIDDIGNVVTNVVTNIIKYTVGQVVILTIGNKRISTTPEHPFRVGNSYVNVSNLRVGDILSELVDGKLNNVTLDDIRYVNDQTVVYNITTSPNHTYFANNIAVHNKVAFQEEEAD